MSNGFFSVPIAGNEPQYMYTPGSEERKALKQAIAEARSKEIEVPMFIGGKEVKSDKKVAIRPPHDLAHLLGYYYKGDQSHVTMAIDAALSARRKWAETPWQDRAAIFLKAADLLAGPYRAKINAATMLGQSKNAYQAEIDAACELIDFLRFNVEYMTDIYAQQPDSAQGEWNRMEYRPLEGFVFALTPFNFTAIAGNLPSAPAIMGNVVVWKPSNSQIYAANVIMEVFRKAGLPDGVINLMFVSGPAAGEVIFSHPDFAGIHYTGSTEVFQNIWKTIGYNIHKFKAYPRIVGETGGKDFIMVHPTADVKQVATAISRGAFEYQGQKCSAASRAYIPKSLWSDIKELIVKDIRSFKMGGVEDFRNFINAVIDEAAFDKLAQHIDNAKKASEIEVVIGGNYDKTKGYFIEPTVLLTSDPDYVTMHEELFGPVITIYLYEDDKYEETIDLLDRTSIYALTGAIFANDREAIRLATNKLVQAAGNFYINDKPTGSVVSRQPFGGARGSGTNDKAGSVLNLMRWTSARTIKESFVAPTDYRYPFMLEE
ncbi:MAG TPA: L-glutamate gamma-semialdehyde dehydrogenase [Bacteroidales bacterium]|nr:L-glutamate gamma-semialdehyde dehydrogenase [Bacteroidales bacterium]